MMTGGQEGDGEGRVGGVDSSGAMESRVGSGEPFTLPTKASNAPSTTTTTTNSNNNNNNSVNGTSEAAILSPDSAIAVTPTTPSPPVSSSAAVEDGAVEDREKNGRQDSLEKTRSEDTTSSEEGYEEDDEGDMEVEELSEEEDEEEVVLSASMQFPLSKSAAPSDTATPTTTTSTTTTKSTGPLVGGVAAGGEGGLGEGLGVTVKIDTSALLKEASPSGCESDIEDNDEEETEVTEEEEDEDEEDVSAKMKQQKQRYQQQSAINSTTTPTTTTAASAASITSPQASTLTALPQDTPSTALDNQDLPQLPLTSSPDSPKSPQSKDLPQDAPGSSPDDQVPVQAPGLPQGDSTSTPGPQKSPETPVLPQESPKSPPGTQKSVPDAPSSSQVTQEQSQTPSLPQDASTSSPDPLQSPQEEPNPTLEPQKAPQSQAIPPETPSSIPNTQTPQESVKSPSEPQKQVQEQSESTLESPSEPPVQVQKSPETEAGVEGAGGVVHLPDTVTRLDTPEGAAVYLVGTAHFSRESQEDVADTIRTVKPDVVVVELCKARTAILQLDEDTILQESRTLDLKKVQMILRQHGKFQGALYILLLSVSAHITKQLGMAPGGEFRTAFAEARRSVPGCLIQLGDRPIQVTLSRALASLSLWHKVKLTWHILTSKEPISKEEVEKCKQRDFILEMLAEMTGQFPAISEVFVKERDLYLCRSLQAAAHTPPGMPPRVVVGVVGIGHVPGIVERWGTVTDKDIAPIMRIPPPTLSSQILKFSAKYMFYGLLGYGAYRWLLPRSAQSALTSTLSSASSSAHTALQSVSSSSSSLFSSLLRK